MHGAVHILLGHNTNSFTQNLDTIQFKRLWNICLEQEIIAESSSPDILVIVHSLILLHYYTNIIYYTVAGKQAYNSVLNLSTYNPK